MKSTKKSQLRMLSGLRQTATRWDGILIALLMLNQCSHPITHVIGYTAEGILECGLKLNNDNFVQTATRTLDSLLRKFNSDGWLKGTYDERWGSNDNYSCLTGDAQIAALWLRLFELTNEQDIF